VNCTLVKKVSHLADRVALGESSRGKLLYSPETQKISWTIREINRGEAIRCEFSVIYNDVGVADGLRTGETFFMGELQSVLSDLPRPEVTAQGQVAIEEQIRQTDDGEHRYQYELAVQNTSRFQIVLDRVGIYFLRALSEAHGESAYDSCIYQLSRGDERILPVGAAWSVKKVVEGLEGQMPLLHKVIHHSVLTDTVEKSSITIKLEDAPLWIPVVETRAEVSRPEIPAFSVSPFTLTLFLTNKGSATVSELKTEIVCEKHYRLIEGDAAALTINGVGRSWGPEGFIPLQGGKTDLLFVIARVDDPETHIKPGQQVAITLHLVAKKPPIGVGVFNIESTYRIPGTSQVYSLPTPSPAIEVKELARRYEVSKQVCPLHEGLVEVILTYVNRGTDPQDGTLTDTVPPFFELERIPDPVPVNAAEQLQLGVEAAQTFRWVLPAVAPEETRVVRYRAKLLEGARFSDILQ
jgi:hypothetical protein